MKKLEPETFCVLTTHEWSIYYYYEGLDCAIYFHLDIVIEQVENQLGIPQVAATLHKAKEIHQQQFEHQKAIFDREGHIGPTPEFSKQSELFRFAAPITDRYPI